METKNQSTQPKKNQSLQKNLTEPIKEIIATWTERDRELIYHHFGIKYPISKKQPSVEVKILNYGNDNRKYNELEKHLLAIQRYKGIRQLLDDISIERLVNFLVKEYGDFNSLEIWTAMDFASAPDNPFNLKHGGETFDSFTPDYLTRILTPYRQYRAKIINRHSDQERELTTKTELQRQFNERQAALTPEQIISEKLEFDKGFCDTAFDSLKDGFPFGMLDRVYDALDRRGLIKFTIERKNQFLKTATDRMQKRAKNDGRTKAIMQAFTNGVQIGKDNVINEAKRVAIEVLFAEMREAGSHVLDLFEEIN